MSKKRVIGDLYRTIRVPMPRLAEAEFAKLISLRQHAGWVWDSLITMHSIIRQERRPWPTMQDLARQMTGQTAALGLMLGTQSQNLLFDEFLGVVRTAQENRQGGKAAGGSSKARFPWRRRAARDVHWDRRDVRSTPAGLLFALAKVPEATNKSGLRRQDPLRIPWRRGIPRNCTAITIHYDLKDRAFYLLFKVKVKAGKSVVSTGAMGVDLGQIRLAACVTTEGQSLNIKGRGLRSLQQGRNKKKAFRSSRIATKVRGSRRRHKEVAKRRRESGKVRRQVSNLLHTVSRCIVDFAARQQVGTIVIGDVVGVRDEDRGRRQNQANSDWPVAESQRLVAYKAEALGIATVLEGEEYTTRTCPACKEVKTSPVSGRIYQCACCGLRGHRDAVGAWNIVSKWHVSAHGHQPPFRAEFVAERQQKYHTPTRLRRKRRRPSPPPPSQDVCSAVQPRSPPQGGEARFGANSTGRGTSPARSGSDRREARV